MNMSLLPLNLVCRRQILLSPFAPMVMMCLSTRTANGEEVIDAFAVGLRTRCTSIRNLQIDARIDETVVDGISPQNLELVPGKPKEFVVPWDVAKGDSKTGFPWMDCEIRIDGARRFLSVKTPQMGRFDSTRESPGKVTKVTRSWNESVAMSLTARSGAVMAQQQLHVLGNPLFKFLDIPVSTVDLRDDRHTFLPDSVDWHSAKLLADESVSGLRCNVIEVLGRDRLWVARDCGYALVKRELRDNEGLLRSVLTTDGWNEVSTGEWLPQRIQREFFKKSSNGTAVVATRVVIESQFHRKEFAPSDFEIDFPVGTNIDNEIEGGTHVIGGNPFVQSADSIHSQFFRIKWHLIVAISIVAALVTFVIGRRIRSRKRY